MRKAKDHVAVRFDGPTIARIDAQRARLSTFWRDATISEALRAIVLEGLTVLEARPAKPEKKGGRR